MSWDICSNPHSTKSDPWCKLWTLNDDVSMEVHCLEQIYHLMRDVGGGGTVWGQGIWEASVPSVQFCYEPKTMLYRNVCLKKKDFSVQRFSPQCYLLKWECSCFTGWAATKRCLGKAHNVKTCPCAVKRWDTKNYIQYYSVVENKYGVKSVSGEISKGNQSVTY